MCNLSLSLSLSLYIYIYMLMCLYDVVLYQLRGELARPVAGLFLSNVEYRRARNNDCGLLYQCSIWEIII